MLLYPMCRNALSDDFEAFKATGPDTSMVTSNILFEMAQRGILHVVKGRSINWEYTTWKRGDVIKPAARPAFVKRAVIVRDEAAFTTEDTDAIVNEVIAFMKRKFGDNCNTWPRDRKQVEDEFSDYFASASRTSVPSQSQILYNMKSRGILYVTKGTTITWIRTNWQLKGKTADDEQTTSATQEAKSSPADDSESEAQAAEDTIDDTQDGNDDDDDEPPPSPTFNSTTRSKLLPDAIEFLNFLKSCNPNLKWSTVWGPLLAKYAIFKQQSPAVTSDLVDILRNLAINELIAEVEVGRYYWAFAKIKQVLNSSQPPKKDDATFPPIAPAAATQAQAKPVVTGYASAAAHAIQPASNAPKPAAAAVATPATAPPPAASQPAAQQEPVRTLPESKNTINRLSLEDLKIGASAVLASAPAPAPVPVARNPSVPQQYIHITDLGNLQSFAKSDLFTSKDSSVVIISILIQLAGDTPSVLLIGINDQVYAIDLLSITVQSVCDSLSAIFGSEAIQKVVFDVYALSAALPAPVIASFRNVVDEQVIHESYFGNPTCSIHVHLKALDPNFKPFGSIEFATQRGRVDYWRQRPFSDEALNSLAIDTKYLLKSWIALNQALIQQETLPFILKATQSRIQIVGSGKFARNVVIDRSTSKLASVELVSAQKPAELQIIPPIVVEQERFPSLLEVAIPERLKTGLVTELSATHSMTSLHFSLGQRPYVMFSKEKKFVSTDDAFVVTQSDIDSFTLTLQARMIPGLDRVAIPGCLHRISGTRSLRGNFVGFTFVARRRAINITNVIADLVLGKPSPSILVIGPSKSGKTTLNRETAATLSSSENVCVIDTFSDIAGDDDSPYMQLGPIRRSVVPVREQQSQIITRTVADLVPSVLIVDEIDRDEDIHAIRTAKSHGIRLIAGAQGTFASIAVDPILSALTGKVTSTYFPDGRVNRSRIAPPIFDAVIELSGDGFNTFTVIQDVAAAADAVVAGHPYTYQKRWRDASTGYIALQ